MKKIVCVQKVIFFFNNLSKKIVIKDITMILMARGKNKTVSSTTKVEINSSYINTAFILNPQ